MISASSPTFCRQVWAGVLGVGPGGTPLTCDYKTVPKPGFQDAVGNIALRVCQVLDRMGLLYGKIMLQGLVVNRSPRV